MPQQKPTKLTPKSAEEFAKTQLKKVKGSVEKRFHDFHSEGVVKTSLRLAENKDVDKNSIIIAGWLHDIGRTKSVKGHAQISFELAEEKFGKLPSKIKDCILNHGSSGKPKTKEGKIIQLADKLSIVQDPRIFKLLFSKKKYKKHTLEMYGYVFKDLLQTLKMYDF